MPMKQKQGIFFGIVLFVVLALFFHEGLFNRAQTHTDNSEHVRIQPTQHICFENTAIFSIAVAETKEARARGLSGTAPLEATEGMLFVFPESGEHPFWMKDMQYPLDMLWLDDTMRVVHIEEQVQPKTFPQTFTNTTPAKYVLELSASSAHKHAILLGGVFRACE